MRSVFKDFPSGGKFGRVMEGITWADLDADEQRAIAVLGAGLSHRAV
jgi:hypothetical protein